MPAIGRWDLTRHLNGLMLKTLQTTLKKLVPTCFGPYIYDHLQGALEQCSVPLLS